MRVSPRNWRLQTQNASPVDSDAIRRWGLYSTMLPKRNHLRVEQGTGPWAGSYYLDGYPWVGGSQMQVHEDLAPGGWPKYSILASDTICGLSDQDIDVHSLNKTCGTVGLLDGFRGMVEAHEYKHQDSLNKCIRVLNRRRLPDIEEITGSQYDVERWLESWHQVADDLDAALTSSQRDMWSSGEVWWWKGGWRYERTKVEGHSGWDGC